VEHQLDAVHGSRYLNGGSANRGALANYIAVKLLAVVLRVVHGLRLSDPAICYKLFRSELVKSWPLRSQGFELCQELNTGVASACRFAELQISYEPRSKKDGKKIVASDFLRAFAKLCVSAKREKLC